MSPVQPDDSRGTVRYGGLILGTDRGSPFLPEVTLYSEVLHPTVLSDPFFTPGSREQDGIVLARDACPSAPLLCLPRTFRAPCLTQGFSSALSLHPSLLGGSWVPNDASGNVSLSGQSGPLSQRGVKCSKRKGSDSEGGCFFRSSLWL